MLLAARFGLAALFFVVTGRAQAQGTSLDGFDGYVTRAMEAFKVPGCAVAVVKDGKVMLVKSYGLRDVRNRLPVTNQTLFPIASMTKSFTVTTLGTLVDEGKLDWDRPVREYLPGFRMFDPVATDELTPRDLVTHRSGLPAHDWVWNSSNFSRKELVERLRYLEPSRPIRQTFQYNNLMFITAGYLAGEISGTSWEEAVTQRILKPLGMDRTVFSSTEARKTSDYALPYRKNRKTEEVSQIDFSNWGGIGPAGGINSNIDDLSRYLLFQLSSGRANGKQLLSASNASQMQSPQMVIQGSPTYAELGPDSYGMGFFVSSYRGHKLVSHGGNLDGFSLDLAFLPEDHIGVVVLTNLDGTALRDLIPYNVFDRLLGLDQIAWVERLVGEEKKARESEVAAEKNHYTGQVAGTHPSHELSAYTGEYANAGYGRVVIAAAGNSQQLDFTLNQLTRPIQHFHYDTFAVAANPLDDLEKNKVTFETDMNGDIESLSIPLDSHVRPIVFARVAEKRMFDQEFLKRFTGEYETAASTMTVALRGNELVTSSPGSPDRRLTAKHGTVFDVAGRPGQRIEFKEDSMVVYTPDGVYVFRKKL